MPRRPQRESKTPLGLLLELTKFRISVAVTLTTITGYILAARRIDAGLLLPLLGTLLLAAGASALNQCQEVSIDARMKRTQRRPIPSGRISRPVAFFVSGLLILLGLYTLASVSWNEHMVLAQGAFAVFWYNGVYTYLKRITAFAVIPGALIGAIPPLIGWTAAGGFPGDPIILLVGGFFFLWQIPHFWLLLLMHGEEYAEAGLPTLTRIFSQAQLARITFMWLLATAASGLLFPAFARQAVALPWSLVLLAISVWLSVKGFTLLWRGGANKQARPFLRAFIQINMYALAVMVFLALTALGVTWP